MGGQHHPSAALYSPGKDFWYLLDRRMGDLRDALVAVATGKILCPCKRSNLNCPVHSPTLCLLSYPNFWLDFKLKLF
jgi:hypothetical protein